MSSTHLGKLLDNLPAIFVVVLMSTILVKFVWKEKKKKQNFSGKSVFITNCESGLGVEIAKRLDKLGFTVFAGFSNPKSETAQRLKYKTSSSLKIVEMDVTNDKSIGKATEYVGAAVEETGLYCLINNGNLRMSGKFEWHTIKQYRKAIDVSLTGMISVTKQFLPLLTPVKGRIINMSGIGGKFVSPYLSINHALKSSINIFSDAMQYEMKSIGITISVIEQEDFLPLERNLMPEEDISAMWEDLSKESKAHYTENFDQWHHAEHSEAKRMLKFEKDIVQKEIHFVEHAITSKNPKKYYNDIPALLKIILCLKIFGSQNYIEKITKLFFRWKY